MIEILISLGLIALMSFLFWLIKGPLDRIAEDTANGKEYFPWDAVDKFMPMKCVDDDRIDDEQDAYS